MNKLKVYPLKLETVKKIVPKLCGNYYIGILSKCKKKFKVIYVGRSTVNIQNRLLDHLKKYKRHYFTFTEKKSKRLSFLQESLDYEIYSGLNNKVKPAKIEDKKSIFESCDKEVESLIKKIKNGRGNN